jgi:hypothetical protein
LQLNYRLACGFFIFHAWFKQQLILLDRINKHAIDYSYNEQDNDKRNFLHDCNFGSRYIRGDSHDNIWRDDQNLGDWDTSSAVALSASEYTSSNPLWFVTLSLAPGTVIQYKYINVNSAGTVTWEADPNHTYTVPASCATTATVSNTWQS